MKISYQTDAKKKKQRTFHLQTLMRERFWLNDKWLSANETGTFEDENQQNQTEKIENEEDEGRKFYCSL
mgnify:CR=1 FL=1